MSFSPEWLALREPADHASINAAVRAALADAVAERPALKIVDLGCGAGSNLRGLSPALPSGQHWTLVDYDPRLLEAARTRLTGFPTDRIASIAYRQADFSGGDFEPLIEGADLVTAAALFDLVSPAVIGNLAAAVARRRQIFSTVLTYDGIAAWLPADPADNGMREAFNRHQHGDKGFGPAAGPDATEALARAFADHGYRIVRGKSPWVLDGSFAELRRDLDRGWAGAVRETGMVPGATIDGWLERRLADPSAVTIVGHEDILALPPR
jgi:SAM-dependent methyltransferase